MQEEEGGWIHTSVRERKEERGNNEVHIQMGRKVILVGINDRNMKTCHVQDHMSYRMTDRQTDRLAQKAAYMYTQFGSKVITFK